MENNIRLNAIKIAKKQDKDLRKINNSGVFFIPELVFEFLLGKALSNSIKFKAFSWNREVRLENYGITDLLFIGDRLMASVHG